MSWLRIDDGFPTHPKLGNLTRSERWTWLEILAYCARYRTRGRIPTNIGEICKYATPSFIHKAVAAGLVDNTEEGLYVHDWDVYNRVQETSAQRQRRYRERVTRDVTGDVTRDVTGDVTRYVSRDVASRARLRARSRPVPNKPSIPPSALHNAGTDGRTSQPERINPEDIITALAEETST